MDDSKDAVSSRHKRTDTLMTHRDERRTHRACVGPNQMGSQC